MGSHCWWWIYCGSGNLYAQHTDRDCKSMVDSPNSEKSLVGAGSCFSECTQTTNAPLRGTELCDVG
jgi:hypothetical protein